MGHTSREHRWASEAFVRLACDALGNDVEWDSIDSGRLHGATCAARTFDHKLVIVAVTDNFDALSAILRDANAERYERALDADVPVWIYVPVSFAFTDALPDGVALRRVG